MYTGVIFPPSDFGRILRSFSTRGFVVCTVPPI